MEPWDIRLQIKQDRTGSWWAKWESPTWGYVKVETEHPSLLAGLLLEGARKRSRSAEYELRSALAAFFQGWISELQSDKRKLERTVEGAVDLG